MCLTPSLPTPTHTSTDLEASAVCFALFLQGLSWSTQRSLCFMCIREKESESVPVRLPASALYMRVGFISAPAPSSLPANETMSFWKKLIWRTPAGADREPTDLLLSQPPYASVHLQFFKLAMSHSRVKSILATHRIFNDRHLNACLNMWLYSSHPLPVVPDKHLVVY